VIAWARHHVQSGAAALRRLGRSPLALALNVVAVGIALALPLGGYLVLENVGRLAERGGAKPQLSVYFALDAGEADIERVRAALGQSAAVKGVRFVARADALRAMQRTLEMSEILAALKTNPLPDVLIADLAPGDIGVAEALVANLTALPKVARVQFDAEWARRLDAVLRLGRLALAMLAGLLAVGLVTVTFNAVRVQILTQRDEIELSKLVGATDAFVRRPFLYQGAALGVLGGLMAVAIVLGSAALLDTEVARLARAYGSQFRLQGLPLDEWATVLAFSGILGLSGAYASVSRYLHLLGPD
jgi:cell division transport system permease protein